MPRTARIDASDLAHHVMMRGIERRVIFRDTNDRLDLIDRFERILGGSDARCYAWALMPNHFHLVLRPGNVPLSRLMARIGTGYARGFNERHDRVGHLFQNRFRSRIVEDAADLAGLVRYVHLNPLVGGVVGSLSMLEHHRWCGYGALLGISRGASFQSIEETLTLFGDELQAARRQLRAWMKDGWMCGLETDPLEADEPVRADVGVSVGRDARWELLIESASSRFGLPNDLLCSGARIRALSAPRAVVAFEAVQRLGLRLREVAARLGVSEAAVSRAVVRGRELAQRASIEERSS